MSPTEIALVVAAAVVVAGLSVREVRAALLRAFRRGHDSGAQAIRALDALMAQPAQPTKDVAILRGEVTLAIRIRAVTANEVAFLQRTPDGMQHAELVSMALVQPQLSTNEVRQQFMHGEIIQLAQVITEFSS